MSMSAQKNTMSSNEIIKTVKDRDMASFDDDAKGGCSVSADLRSRI